MTADACAAPFVSAIVIRAALSPQAAAALDGERVVCRDRDARRVLAARDGVRAFEDDGRVAIYVCLIWTLFLGHRPNGESPPRFPRWGLRLVDECALGEIGVAAVLIVRTVPIYRAADGYRAAGAASACADAVGSTADLRGGQAGHSFCNRDVTACATMTRTDSGGTSSIFNFTAS